MKIGQEIIIEQEFNIGSMLTGKESTVKKGDKGFITSRGWLHMTTGECKGKIIKKDDIEVQKENYDHLNISKLIANRLNCVYGIEEFFIDNDIDNREFVGEIEDILMDIL